MPVAARKPAFVAFLGRFGRIGFIFVRCSQYAPEHNLAGTILAPVRFRRYIETKAFMADIDNHPVDEFEDFVRRAKALPQIEILQASAHVIVPQLRQVGGQPRHLAANPFLSPGEIVRAGPLKAEDRLLVVPDHEQGPQLVDMGTVTGEEIPGQGIDNLPLRRVGILCFVNQHVIEPPVQLVADPLGQFAAGQQRCSLANLVVEIDKPGAGLGLVPFKRKSPAKFQRGGKEISEIKQGATIRHGAAAGQNRQSRVLEMLFELTNITQILGRIIQCEQHAVKLAKPLQTVGRPSLQPGSNRGACGLPRGCTPLPISREAAFQRVGIEYAVAA